MRSNLNRPSGLAAVALLVFLAVAGTSAGNGSPLRLTGMREDINRPGLLRLVIGFSGPGLSANRVDAKGFTHPPGDPTTLATATLTVSGTLVTHVPTLRTQDGTLVHATQRGANARITLDPKAGRYKYLYYSIPDPGHILILLWRSGTPGAPAYVTGGFPRGCIVLDHTRRPLGSITAFGHEHGIFENQFMLALRNGKGRRFTRTTIHAGSRGAWSGTLTYHVSQEQWGTLEAVAFSPKDEAISCIAQIAVKLQTQ
jgi:hypothetical protein